MDKLGALLEFIGEYNYRNGFPYLNSEYRKRRKLFNPLISNTFLTLIIIRDFISYFICDEFYSILIGDYVFKFEYKVQWNLIFFICYFTQIFNQIHCHIKHKSLNKCQQILNNIEFNANLSNVKKTVFRFINGLKLYINFIHSIGFLMAFLFFWMECSVIQLFTFGLFWSILK